jgi:hypothetical protein
LVCGDRIRVVPKTLPEISFDFEPIRRDAAAPALGARPLRRRMAGQKSRTAELYGLGDSGLLAT